jgi:hypothetical protein
MARADRPPRPPRRPSETDGYDDYRERFRSRSRFGFVGRRTITALACATWFAVSVFAYYLLVPAKETEVTVVLAGLFAYGIVGPVGAAVYWLLVFRFATTTTQRVAAAALAIAAFVWAAHIW